MGVQIWSDEACEQLRDCFESTEWDILCTSDRLHHGLYQLLRGKHCAIQKGTVFPKQQTLGDSRPEGSAEQEEEAFLFRGQRGVKDNTVGAQVLHREV